MNKLIPEVAAMNKINFSGNVIPSNWYGHLRYDSGKTNLNAIIILSEIVYWYRPSEVRDEETGQLLGYKKKFKADKLQRSYSSFSKQFGLTKKQVRDALGFLENKGLITKELRTIVTEGITLSNVLFIGILPTKIKVITTQVTPMTYKSHPPNIEVTPSLPVSHTYTETTTETTTETPSADAENGTISKQPDKHNGLYKAEEVDEAIAQFVSVTGFAIPTAKRQLKLWQTGVKEHLTEEQFSGQLPELYQCVWDNIEERVRAGELTITHPGAFTQYMYGIIQSKNKVNGPMTLDQLVSAGIVEVKTIEDKVGFFWPDGTLVGDITPELIEKHSHHEL